MEGAVMAGGGGWSQLSRKTSNLSLFYFVFMSVYRQVSSFSLPVCLYVFFGLLFSFFRSSFHLTED